MHMVLTSTYKPGDKPDKAEKAEAAPKTHKNKQAAPESSAPPVANDGPEAPAATSTGG
jgi:hypothetical protein